MSVGLEIFTKKTDVKINMSVGLEIFTKKQLHNPLRRTWWVSPFLHVSLGSQLFETEKLHTKPKNEGIVT